MLAALFVFILPFSFGLFVGSILGWAIVWGFFFKKVLHITSFFLFFFILILSGWGIIHLNPVQNWLVDKSTAILSKNLKTKVSIKHVDFSLFNKLSFEGVIVEDRKKDTLVYAGALKVNITDWFFIKKKITLQYLGLSDAVINLNRTDSVWNYQFLVDYFSSPKSGGGSKSSIHFDLKTVDLKNVSFNRSDGWIGQDLEGSFKKLHLTADEINFSDKKISINQIDIVQPIFTIHEYDGGRPANLAPQGLPYNTADSGQLKWNAGNWQMLVKKINVKDGIFNHQRETERGPYTDHFDGQHFVFSQINGELTNIVFAQDTISASIKLSTKEKSGFEVKQLFALMKVTPEMMEFNNLEIITNKSRIGNYYAMRYKNFNADMSDFLHAVKLEAHFTESKIHSDDIAFFAPELRNWNRLINFTGKAKGSIDNLSAENFTLKSDNTIVNGDISMNGLPDIFNTFIDFKSHDLKTTYNDLVKLVPTLSRVGQKQLSRLGNIRFKGNYTGFLKDFVAYGNISTSLGNLNADVNMKLPDNKTPTYSGKISSAGLNFGILFNNSRLGNAALDGKVTGSGFTVNDLNMDFTGKVHSLEYGGYPYQNITIDGTFVKTLFTGRLDINDANLVIKNLNGSVNLLGDTTNFNFNADLEKANLQNLNFTKDNFVLSGQLNLNFVGNTIDNFLGTAKLYDATLYHDSSKLSFDFLSLNSVIENGNKKLNIESNEVEGNITGQFRILELPDAFSIFLNRYYPSYFQKPDYEIGDEDFSFNIETKQVDEFVRLFDNRLKGFDNSVFSGNLRLGKNEFNVNASVPDFSYDGKIFQQIVLAAKGNLDSLNTNITVKEIKLSDSLRFPNTKLVFSSSNDITNIQLSTSASKTLSDAQLNARLQTYPDGVKINFSPSSFILNDKKWNLSSDGELTVRKSYIEANDVRFTQGNQEIVISTELDELADHTNLVAKLKKVNINDFTQLIITEPRLEGVLTGTLKLRDPFGKKIIEYDALAEDFRFDNKEIGKLKVKGEVNTTTGEITAKGDAEGHSYKFDIDGKYNYKDTSGRQMNFKFHADKFDISILDNYLTGIFSNMTGNLNSDLVVYGGAGHNYVTGIVNITEGSLKVDYTQCVYRFNNETIHFNPDEIDFGLLQLKDTLNNSGTASGKLKHEFFNNFGFDNIRFETGKMLVLNTTSRDNSQFYGKVIGKALMTLNGPVTDMRMNITGEPSSVDSSHIYIPSSTSQEFGKIDYIDFIQYGSKMEDEYKGRTETNFFVTLNLTANPACKIDVILDEVTGDVIKGRGNGLLNITVGTKEPLTMRGRYDIVDGEYRFNFQTVFKKYFAINTGSITWNGDPYEAQINIDAEYLAPNVDLSSLATSRGKYQQKSDLLIIAKLTNTLSAPKIAFEFEIPKNKQTDFSNDPVLLENLKKFSRDENEQNRQVASLLLFNTFISDNNGGFGASTFSFLSGTAGQVISGFLNNQLTKVFQKLFNDPTITPYISFNSNYNLTSTELINALEASGNFGFKKAYVNGRLVVSLGGNIDYNNPYILQARNTNVLLTPDITVEYLLSKDGKLRIVGFNRTVVDATLGQRNRTGVRLSYSRDFDLRTKEERILLKEERKKKKNNQP